MSFQGMSRSIDPMGQRTRRDTAWKPHPAPIVSISLQPGIPWRVALPQSPPPLPPAVDEYATKRWESQPFPSERQPVPYLLVSPNDRTALPGLAPRASINLVPLFLGIPGL